MSKKIITIIMGTLLALCVGGCGDSLNNVRSYDQTSVNHSLHRPLSELLYGLTKMQKFVENGEYSKAKTLSHNLSDEFHDAIMPYLKERKGNAYAEKIHGKYDELEIAVASKDKTKIKKLIRENQNNIKTIAPILGVSLISF